MHKSSSGNKNYITQKSVKRSSRLLEQGELIARNSIVLSQNANNASNDASLKGKLTTLEDRIQKIAGDMNSHKTDVIRLRNEKDELQEMLKQKTNDVKILLLKELYDVEDQMKTQFSHQKSENGRLQQQISTIKAEETVLQNQLIALQRRISDLEMQVGTDDVKFG